MTGTTTGITAWDITTDPDNPQPNVWPRCSLDTCHTAYAYQWCMSWTGGSKFAWVRNCKHKADAELVTKDGLYVPPGGDDK